MDSNIKAAIDEAGGATKVAESLAISRISVYEWISKDQLPANRVIPLAGLTNWKFTPHVLDSTLYPNPSDGLPPGIAAVFALSAPAPAAQAEPPPVAPAAT